MIAKKPGQPAKDAKGKKGGAEEEISAEEKARLASEKQVMDDVMAERQQQWANDFTDSQKFFRVSEDPFKEPCIKFPPPADPNDQSTRRDSQTISKSDDSLREFEAMVNEKRGCWLYFDKLPPPEEEEKKGAKAPAKSKAPVEELKPVYGRAWVDLTALQYQGQTQITERFLLCTIFPQKQETEINEIQSADLVFEKAQTYVSVTISLSQPLNPPRDDNYIRYSSSMQQYDDYPQPKQFPPTSDAINEFQRQIHLVTKEIGVEYAKMFSQENEGERDSPRGKQQTTILSSMQMREVRENRKEKFLLEFNTSPKYLALREKVKKAVFRIVVEKFKKTVGPKGLTASDRNKFKAELYVFLGEQMRVTLDLAIDLERDSLPQDIVCQKDCIQDDRQKLREKCFQEDTDEKNLRLYKEADTVLDLANSERYMTNFYKNTYWEYSRVLEYVMFALKYGMQSKAEVQLKRYAPYSQGDQDVNLILGSLMLQRDQFRVAKDYFNQLLDKDWKHSFANLLMGILYDSVERSGLSRKHFAIAKVKRMRELNLLPPKSTLPKNFRTIQADFKVEIIDFKNVTTKDSQLSADQSDALYFELAEYLLGKAIFGVADLALGYVKDRNTERFLMNQAKIRVLQGRYSEAVQELDKLLLVDQKNQKAWILRGHAYFFAGNLFDSEESYIKALRLKPTPKDPVMQERLGIVYAKRKAWKDARVVFLKNCKEFTSTTSWNYLGISLLRLGELVQAEDAFTQANILNNTDPKTWGYMAILCLMVGKDRSVQAEMCFKEALRMGLNDIEILEEIGDLYAKDGFLDLAIMSYQKVIEFSPQYGEGWQKLADVQCNGEDASSKRPTAIDCYKRAIELIEGENNKSKIAMTLQQLLRLEGRDDDIEPYRKYLLEASLSD